MCTAGAASEDGTPRSTVPPGGLEHYDPSLHRKTDHCPGGQKTAHVRAVEDRLAPAVLVENVDADPAEPDGEDEDEGYVVDGSEERQVETGALAIQPRRADVHQEGDGVTDDADQYDDWQDINVENGYDTVEFSVGFVAQQLGQLNFSSQVASGCVETHPEVFQQERHSFVEQKQTIGEVNITR